MAASPLVRGTTVLPAAPTQPRITELPSITTIPTMVVALRTLPSPRSVITTPVRGGLVAGGANGLKAVWDCDVDALMERTKHVPTLPVVADPAPVTRQTLFYTVALVAISVILVPVAHLSLGSLAVAGVAGVVFLWRALQRQRHPSARRAIQLFGLPISYLTVRFAVMGVDAVLRHP